MAITLKIDNEGLFLLGQTLQEQEHLRESTSYLDLENGRVVAFEEEDLQKTQERIEARYVEIPCISHGELHEWLNEFVWSLNNEEARKAGEGKYGIGDTLRTLDEYMHGDATWQFSVFVAKKWLASLEIQIAE